MTAAKTTIVAGGVPYEVTDKRSAGESVNDFVVRHLQHVRVFVSSLGDPVESLTTEFQ